MKSEHELEGAPKVSRQETAESLQQLIDRTPDFVDYLYNDAVAPHFSRSIAAGSFIPPAFTNWRDEQMAWQETAALLHQSHHMPELFLRGPDALKLIERIGVNSVRNFTTDRAKQIVGVTPSGHVIGDCIVYRLGEDSFEFVSGMPLLNWVEYTAQAEKYNVDIQRDDPSNITLSGQRTNYRFQIDGPNAGKIFDEMVDGDAPEIPFFRTARVSIRNHQVLVLRHGMAGHQGVELSGPFAEERALRDIILEFGQKHGIVPVGTTAYFTAVLSDAWMANPLPAIFTGEELRGFREWLSGSGWEANTQIGGSFRSRNIEDYYSTPYDLGYGSIVKFDHDFIGRQALESIPDEAKRTRVTLVWNRDDVLRVFASQFGHGPRFKSIDFPLVHYSWTQFDEVCNPQGELIGWSGRAGYLNPEGEVLSLASLNYGHAEMGAQVILTWGEPDGGSRKTAVERHEQTHIRATIAPAPYSKAVREMKRRAVGRR
jgi:vanillate/3-O-methylgallate O-demethylase